MAGQQPAAVPLARAPMESWWLADRQRGADRAASAAAAAAAASNSNSNSASDPGQAGGAPRAQQLPAHAAVVVVGAGLTGTAAAYHLSERGRACVVLDARGVAHGATGRNGGHLWADASSDFEVATTAELLDFLASRNLEAAVDLQRGGGVLLRKKPAAGGGGDARGQAEAVRDAAAEGHPLKATGASTEWDAATCASRLGTAAFASGRYSADAMQFSPCKVAHALLEASPLAKLFAPVHVASIEHDGACHVLRTSAGDIRADQVVVCASASGMPSFFFFWLRARVRERR